MNDSFPQNPALPSKISVHESKYESDEFFTELILSFRQALPEFANQLQACHDLQDFEELKRHAHRLRGTALVLGFDGLAEHFYALERLCTFVPDPETFDAEVATIRKVQGESTVATIVQLMREIAGHTGDKKDAP